MKKEKDLMIGIPTKNHPQYIRYYLAKTLDSALKYNIDIGIYDSSDDDLTKNIVTEKINQGYSNLFYKRCSPDTLSQTKIRDILVNTGYRYNWLCGDGIVINIDKVISTVKKEIDFDRDVIIFSFFKEHVKYKEFFDCVDMLPYAWNPLSLYGGAIYKGDLFSIDEWNKLSEKYTENIHFTGIFEHFLQRKRVNAVVIKTEFFTTNPYKKDATWVIGGRILEVETKVIPKEADNLPKEFDNIKPIARRLFADNGKTFSKRNSWSLRKYDNLTLKKVWEYRKELGNITDSSWIWFAIVAMVPKKIALQFADIFSE